jgi:hypothetical protein
MHLANAASFSQLFRGDFLEARNNAGTSCHGNELDINTTNPSDGWQFVLQQEMVGFIFEPPLAKSDVAAIFLKVADHVSEIFLFQLVKFLEAFS